MDSNIIKDVTIIPFDKVPIDKLKNNRFYEIITEHGEEVKIIDWNYPNTYNILASVYFSRNLAFPMLYDEEGNAHHTIVKDGKPYSINLMCKCGDIHYVNDDFKYTINTEPK